MRHNIEIRCSTEAGTTVNGKFINDPEAAQAWAEARCNQLYRRFGNRASVLVYVDGVCCLEARNVAGEMLRQDGRAEDYRMVEDLI